MPAGTTYWTRDQVLIALNLYTQLPFGKLDARTPIIQQVSALLGRTAGSLSMKLNNLASLDPAITADGRVGLTGASALDREVWTEFTADPQRIGEESQRLMDSLVEGTAISELSSDSALDLPPVSTEEGTTAASIVNVRRGQAFFRRAVLASYESRCCMSGLQTPRLLVASHIKAWKADVTQRLNPRNGLCLSALHDRAFDLGYLSVRPDLSIVISPELAEDPGEFSRSTLQALSGKRIGLPNKFHPDPAFLEWHFAEVFRR